MPTEAWAREWLPTILTGSASPDLVEELKAILADFHPRGQRALLDSGFAEQDLRDLLPRIKVPTLLLYGEKDVRSPLNVDEAMHASIPGSQPVIVPGSATWWISKARTARTRGSGDSSTP